ncbi:MAG: DUF222 domain-containing protein [Acidimicrobiales bacterium]
MLGPAENPHGEARYLEVLGEISEALGQVNAAQVRLLEVVEVVVEERQDIGPGLRSTAHFLAWRTGLSLAHCKDLVRVVRRRHELPCLYGALKAGELTIDQAAVVAAHVPGEYDESVTAFARTAMVSQLREALPRFGFSPKPRPKPTGLEWGCDDGDGSWWIRGRLSPDAGALVDHALSTRREDLRRARRAELPAGEQPEPVTNEDALWSLAESALRDAEAARPSSGRYRVHLHLEQGADGDYQLTTTLGRPLPAAFRRHLLCDTTIAALVHTGLSDLAAGRTQHAVPRKLRRAVLQRDKGCRIHGCRAKAHLEVHHIDHWEDGGTTSPHNLITLCWHHHHLHHQGQLAIAGTATDLTLEDAHGNTIEPVGQPTPPQLPLPPARRYPNPTGEPIIKANITFTPNPTTTTLEHHPPNPDTRSNEGGDSGRGGSGGDGPPG